VSGVAFGDRSPPTAFGKEMHTQDNFQLEEHELVSESRCRDDVSGFGYGYILTRILLMESLYGKVRKLQSNIV
jgi:hypothetical protein